MRRTAQFIEELKAVGAEPSAKKKKRRGPGKPFKKGNEYAFKPGESGNPGGLPGTDLAAKYARELFERHPEGISGDLAVELKGFNAYAYGVLADRAYGKIKEKQEVEHTGKGGEPLKIVVELIDAKA